MTSVCFSSVLLICVALSYNVSADNFTEVTSQTMHSFFDSEIFSKYNQHVRPVFHLEDTVEVHTSLTLYAITELDCVLGVLHTIGHLEITWTDKLIAWKNYSNSYRDIDTIRMRSSDVWIPPVVVSNAFDDVGNIDTENGVIVINDGGEMIWKPRVIITSLCTTNVQYFPFDIQTCNISFAILGYMPKEVKFVTFGEESIDIKNLNSNAEWTIDQSKVYNTFSQQSSKIHFEITMARKPVYFVINLLLPVLLITILITCSFMLPAEEGRGQLVSIGYITLSFYFIHTISFLPKASDTVTYLGYFFMWQMIYSVLVSVSAILSIFLYFKSNNETIPKFLDILVSFVIKRSIKKKARPNITRITVVPSDPERMSNTYSVIDPQRSPSFLENASSETKYMYPGINRQESVQSQALMEDSGRSVENHMIGIERQISNSSGSSNSSGVKRARKISSVISNDVSGSIKAEGQQGGDDSLLTNRATGLQTIADPRRLSTKTVHWRQQIESDGHKFTSEKLWRTSIIRPRFKNRQQNKQVETSLVILDNRKCRNEKIENKESSEPHKTRGNNESQNRKVKKICNKQVTWRQVSLTLDKIFLFSFFIINVLISTFFLFPLAARL